MEQLDTTARLDHEPLAPTTVVDGSPTTGTRALTTVAGAEVGVWEMTAGTATDVEVDEVFVVLSGSATVTVEGGTPLDLRPGVVVRLHAGDRTTWQVHETLRKVYLA